MNRPEEIYDHTKTTELLKRFAKPEQVAAQVTFVGSPLSSATNGAALRMNSKVVPFTCVTSKWGVRKLSAAFRAAGLRRAHQ